MRCFFLRRMVYVLCVFGIFVPFKTFVCLCRAFFEPACLLVGTNFPVEFYLVFSTMLCAVFCLNSNIPSRIKRGSRSRVWGDCFEREREHVVRSDRPPCLPGVPSCEKSQDKIIMLVRCFVQPPTPKGQSTTLINFSVNKCNTFHPPSP